MHVIGARSLKLFSLCRDTLRFDEWTIDDDRPRLEWMSKCLLIEQQHLEADKLFEVPLLHDMLAYPDYSDYSDLQTSLDAKDSAINSYDGERFGEQKHGGVLQLLVRRHNESILALLPWSQTHIGTSPDFNSPTSTAYSMYTQLGAEAALWMEVEPCSSSTRTCAASTWTKTAPSTADTPTASSVITSSRS